MTTATLAGPEPEDSDKWDGTDIEPVFTIRYSEEENPENTWTLSDDYISGYREGDKFS